MQHLLRPLSLAAALALGAGAAHAQSMAITEWMYSGAGPEFIEFTNMSGSAIDLTGWVYDDDSAISTSTTPLGSKTSGASLSSLGLVAAGESVILTEGSADAFRTAWGLSASVKIIGGYTNNLGRADQINIFDATGAVIDSLSYDDQNYAGTVRTQYASGTATSAAALSGATVTASAWVLSSVGDSYGSIASSTGDIGNPGHFVFAPVPEASTVAMMLAGLGLLGAAARRTRRAA